MRKVYNYLSTTMSVIAHATKWHAWQACSTCTETRSASEIHAHCQVEPAASTGFQGRRPKTLQTSAMPSATGPAVFAIAAPEGIRGNVEEGMDEVTSFSQQEYDKFLQGYKSQYKELSFWVGKDAIEGN